MTKLRSTLRDTLFFIIDFPQLFLREVLENPYKFAIFACLLVVAIGELFPSQLSEIPSIISHLQVEVLSFLIFGYFVLVKKNEQTLYSKTETDSDTWRLGKIQIKEKHVYFTLLLLLFVTALVIRWWKIAALDPYTDENGHLLEASRFLKGDKPSYSRARFLSVLIYLMWKITNASSYIEFVFWSRIPSIVVGSLTVFPLYLVAQRISRPVAFLSCIFWTFSPWSIGVSRYAREYAFYPILILLILHLYLSAIEHIRNRGLAAIRRVAVYGVLISLYIVLAIIDYKSTLKIGFLVLGAVILWNLCELLLSRLSQGANRQNRYVSYAVFLLGIIAIIIFNYGSISGVGYNLHPRFLNAFLLASDRTPTMWWTDYKMISRIPSLFIFISCIYFGYKKDRHFFSIFSIFVVLIFFYYLMFDRYFRPRYCYYVLPFFCIIVASGVYALLDLVRIFHIRSFRVIAMLILAIFMFSVFDYKNVRDSIIPTTTRETGYYRPTGEYHQLLRPTLNYLSSRIQTEDAYITTVFYSVLIQGLNIPLKRIYWYPYKAKNTKERVERIMRKHDYGWMVLDKRRHGIMVPTIFPTKPGKTFTIGDKIVKMVRNKDEAQIYRWKPKKKKKTEEPTAE